MRTRGISDSLTEVMGNFSGEGRNDLIAKLRQIMDVSSRFLNNFDTTSSRAVVQLSGLMKIVEELPDTLKEFDRLVSQLRIMGITTRIETERLGLTNMGFEHLAQEVTMLGENISLKAKEVQSSLRTIIAIVRVNERSLVRLRENHKGLQESVSRNMNSDMQLLSEKHEVLVKVIEDVSIQSQDAIHTLNTIVGAIQFHDITRQQIEHVIDALKDLLAQLQNGTFDSTSSHLIVVCELQPVQLERARIEYTNAVLSMISSFGSLSSTVKVMQAESHEAIGFAGGDGTTFFTVVGNNLQHVTAALTEGERAIREFLDSLQQIGEVVEKMKMYMDEMSEVGIEVEMLALNSRIRSAKAQERGAALGVISESIQRISNTSQVHIDEVVGSIGSLVKATEEMEQQAKNAELVRSTETTIEDMTRDLKSMIGVFESSSVAGTEILRRTDTISTGLSAELDLLAAVIRESRQEADVIRKVESVLSAIAVEARGNAPEFVLDEVEERLAELKTRYTMHTERDIHDAYLEGRTGSSSNSESTESSIELF